MKKIFLVFGLIVVLNGDDLSQKIDEFGKNLDTFFKGGDFNKSIDELANIAKIFSDDIAKFSKDGVKELSNFIKENEKDIQELIDNGEKIAKELNQTFNKFEKEFEKGR